MFQGSNIRVYNVDRGWKVQKNILAKSLRWTITDTSLSPDQRFLVSPVGMSLSIISCIRKLLSFHDCAFRAHFDVFLATKYGLDKCLIAERFLSEDLL